MEHYKSRNNDFFHFSNPNDDGSQFDEEDEDDDDDRSCDFSFHPFRPLGITHSPPSTLQNCGLIDQMDTPNTHEELGTFSHGALISEIDHNMKKLSDNLLYAIEGLATRLSQLDGKTCQLQNSVDDLKNSTEYYHVKTDRKFRQLQDIVQEVQDGVQFLREKHEIAEAKLQLAKLQVPKRDGRTDIQRDSVQQVSLSAPQLSPNPPTAIDLNSTAQLPHYETPSLHPESYYQPAWQNPEVTFQQYHFPTTQQSQSPRQPVSQLPHFPQSPQLPQMHSLHANNHPFLSHHSEEKPYMPYYSYPSSIHQSSSQPTGWGPTQGLDVGFARQPPRSVHSEFLAEYSSEAVHPYSKLPSSLGGSNMKPVFSPTRSAARGGDKYLQIPTAKVLPHALPTASIVDNGLGSGGNDHSNLGNDVVEKVTAMGFRRDLVKATVKKPTEKGQSVDLNAVLVKMMNNG